MTYLERYKRMIAKVKAETGKIKKLAKKALHGEKK